MPPTTERLYWRDAYQRRFSSEVLAVQSAEDGCRVLLASSLFYPDAGGQPHDRGQLNGRRVLAVDDENGALWHRLEGAPLQVADSAHGEIDWPRRYRHMQRHSAQHLLSQAFVRLDPAYATQAVSLAGPVCTLDVTGDPDDETLKEAESLVNQACYANLPVESFEVAAEELAAYPLRRPPKVTGRVRLVKMGDWELSACGGTHLRSSAEALPVKLLRLERVKAGLARVHVRCGLEALEDYAQKHAVAQGLVASLSVRAEELPARVAALQAELADTARARERARSRCAALLAERLLAAARRGARGRVVAHRLADEDAELIQPLAQALVREDDVMVLLGCRQDQRAQLLFARASSVPLDMRTLLRGALAAIGGQGGGRAERAQGSGNNVAELEAALEGAAQSALAPGDAHS